MSSYQAIPAGTRRRGFTVVTRTTGAPVTTGTVNYYLLAKSGANAGKWWNDSTQSWAASETANAMSHDADGHWELVLDGDPFADGINYLEYVKTSGDTHVPDGRRLVGYPATNVIDSLSSAAILQLRALGIEIVNPLEQTTNRLTIVRGRDYTSDSLGGVLRFKIDHPGATAGDTVHLGLEGSGTETLQQTGTIVDDGGTLYAEISLTAAATTLTPTARGTYELIHVSATDKLTSLLAHQPLTILDDTAVYP